MSSLSRRAFMRTTGLGALGMMLWGRAETATRKPNVVFILADDLGWRDTTPYGSTFYETPNIARLAERGMLFTQAYAAAPLCSATRSSLMTGQWPARVGITGAGCHTEPVRLEATAGDKCAPWMRACPAREVTRLNTTYYTMAEAFRDAGYRTGHFGKWHLGREPYSPLDHGFEVDVPHWHGPGPAGSYVAPWAFPDALQFTGEPGEHIEDRMAREATRFIQAHRDEPFFLNYWCFSVHGPWGGKPDLTEYFGEKDGHDPGQRSPVYAAMVKSMDDAVGTLLDVLDREGLTDNTIVVFTSDNGGIDFVNVNDIQVTSNAPLRAGKASIYEGGTREPLIVSWPGHVAPGSRNEKAIVSTVDFYPTFKELCGLSTPEGQHFDGVSIAPALQGKKLPRDTIYCHFPHNTPATGQNAATYVRKGPWKLVRTYGFGPDGGDRHELYNLRKDPGEQNDLSAARKDKTEALAALMDAFLKDTGAVVPKANSAWDPSAKVPPRGKAFSTKGR